MRKSVTLSEKKQATILKRGYAKNLAEWWFLVEDEWENLKNFFHPFTAKQRKSVEKAYTSKDALSLYRWLSRAWEALPDSPRIQEIPGFNRLCNLCSDFPSAEAAVKSNPE